MTDELDKICEQDERIKNHLSRREKITHLVRTNRNNLEQSLGNLDFDNLKLNSNSGAYNVKSNSNSNGRKFNNYD